MTAERSRQPGRVIVPAAAALFGVALAAAPLPASAQADGGISVEEYHRVFPPAPVGVRAVAEAGAVVVTWSAPPRVAGTGQPAYDPVIVAYRVYAVDGTGGRTLLGEVPAVTTHFRDESSGAADRSYSVTAVQRSGQESGLSAATTSSPP